ncbi:heterokaryon incompatibility protein-domain-containing protein [Xylaria grammica]|nr:heterokaryon incompatibility protein-domain-containing protein [Xylaria grammica]
MDQAQEKCSKKTTNMARCNLCRDLQVDQTTNLTAEETSRPESYRLRTFSISETLQDWHQSAQATCAICRLVWQVLSRFDKDATLDKLLRISSHPSPSSSPGSDDNIYLELSGFIGQTLLLEFVELPADVYFPTLELFSRDGKHQLDSSDFFLSLRFNLGGENVLIAIIDTLSCFRIIGAASEVASDLDLSLCSKLTKKWLQDCRLKHPQCVAQRLGTLPTRVLDVGESLATAPDIRLLETEPDLSAEYVALSYCWGKTGNITTTKKTLEERKKDIAWGILPKSFQDAIEVVRGLGIRYIWIDALCIIQDDAADWERESAKMADVYENAFLTISTDAAQDPTQGIFTARRSDRLSTADTLATGYTARPARNIAVEQFPVTDEIGETHIVYAREPLSHSDIISPRSYYDVTYPLMSRAWTLQERLLSSRILHVTAAELIWECKTTLCCECGTISRESDYLSGNPSPKIAYDVAMQNIIEEGRDALHVKGQEAKQSEQPLTPKTSREWTLLIGGYSNRMLTYEIDKLPAISALARRFSLIDELRIPRTYLAGLWLEDLPWLLCWRVFQRRFEKRPEKYCAPTWSWASISTPVIWDMEIYEAKARVEVLDACAAPVGQANAFGRVKGAYATLRGLVQRAVLEVDVQHNAVLALRNIRGERIFFVPDLNPPDHHDAKDISPETQNQASFQSELKSTQKHAPPRREIFSNLRDGGELACFWLLQGETEDKAYGLVLVPAPDDAIARCPRLPHFDGTGKYSKDVATFERAGLVTAMSRVYQKNEVSATRWFVGAELETVCIV